MFGWFEGIIDTVLPIIGENFFKWIFGSKKGKSGGLVERRAEEEPPYRADVGPFQYGAEYSKDDPFKSTSSPGIARQVAALKSETPSDKVSNHFERLFIEATRKAKGIG